MHGLYVNTGPFYFKGLQHPKILISVGVLGLGLPRKPRDEWPDKNPMPGHLSELHPVNEVNTKGQ